MFGLAVFVFILQVDLVEEWLGQLPVFVLVKQIPFNIIISKGGGPAHLLVPSAVSLSHNSLFYL